MHFKGVNMNIIKFICKYTNLKIRILSWVFLGIAVSAFILGMVSMFDWIFTELASTLILSMAASLIAITLILLNKNKYDANFILQAARGNNEVKIAKQQLNFTQKYISKYFS